jgi:hypothetical protein
LLGPDLSLLELLPPAIHVAAPASPIELAGMVDLELPDTVEHTAPASSVGVTTTLVAAPTAAPLACAPTAASVTAFIDSIRLPLEEPLIKTPRRARTARTVSDDWIPRRSDRLAAKSVFRDPHPESQARRILLNKWAGRPEDAVTNTPDATISTKFHEQFGASVSSSKREAIRELFPMRGSRWTRTAVRLE